MSLKEEMNTDYYDLVVEFKHDDETTDYLEKGEADDAVDMIDDIVNKTYPDNYEWTAFFLGNGDAYVIVNNTDTTGAICIEISGDEGFVVATNDNVLSSDDIFESVFYQERID